MTFTLRYIILTSLLQISSLKRDVHWGLQSPEYSNDDDFFFKLKIVVFLTVHTKKW